MRTLVLSDLYIENLHHAYVCSDNGIEAINDWWNALQPSPAKIFTYHTLGIDDAKELKQMSGYTTDSACIIISAAAITREAQNALLKLFEEPVAGMHFFLVVPSFDILIPTLVSRVQKISTETESEPTFNAEKFLKDSPESRLTMIEKLLKKADEGDEAKSAITRTITDSIEEALVNNPKLRNNKTLEILQTIRKYQNLQGASHKILLEYIALTA